MILKSFRNFFSLLIIFLLFFYPLYGDEKIDIWKNQNKKDSTEEKKIKKSNGEEKKVKIPNKIKSEEEIKIEDGLIENLNQVKVFGVHDPEDFNFNLNMWSTTKADDVRASIKRIRKIKLSKTSNEILENILLSFSYPPKGMNEKEFVELKVNWLIENNRLDLLENFLRQNKEFEGKSRAVQYLVDENIAQANIKTGCDKIKFIDKTIKDSYLEKFKIYCLVFNNQKPQAQLLLDLLREQNQSDKFFDDKINFLLGISEKTSKKINEKNLLNFYLSSVTIENFKYEPTDKTKKEIWKYLNAANLIKLEDVNNNEKLTKLEFAADKGQIDPDIIFNFYKQKNFNLNTLINAKNVYQTLEPLEARSLIYQKYLLSEEVSPKIEYLFLLEELFKKDKLEGIVSYFLIKNLKEIGLENIPSNYKELAERKIQNNQEKKIGKVRYNDKIIHQSKILRFYTESENQKKIQKDINKIFKKIEKNRKYFYSAKDLALIETLIKDGFQLPKNFNYKELSKKFEIPKNLLDLTKNKQNAFLALKIVEIIGEDEPYELDPETIYFITYLLNEIELIKIRNKVLISALPLRV